MNLQLGYPPWLVSLRMNTIRQIRSQFKVTILAVEQNVRETLKIVDQAYVLRLGVIILEENEVDSQTESKIRKVFLS
jgi:ABC-type branched-subunit amino acid transport system ATPase component